MKTNEFKGVIPEAMLPSKGVTEVVDPQTGHRVLLVNSVMFTGYQHSQGRFSEEFFIPLRDRAVIMGRRCTKCGEITCPPYQLLCPHCNFAATELVELPDRGVMLASPPITLFGNSFFKEQAPFARGYVLLGEAATGLPVWCKTTTGMIRPGIFRRGTPVKVVFNDVRDGLITDVCIVPESELTAEQIAKSPLLASEVNWEAVTRPSFGHSNEAETNLRILLDMQDEIQTAIAESPRAIKNLSNWTVAALVHTAGGDFGLGIDRNTVLLYQVGGTAPATFDFELAVADPNVFLDWWSGEGEALTNLLMDGTMWMSSPKGLETVFKLDRLPRSVRRDQNPA